MKQESHILIKYLVIPIMFISLLVAMDFLSTGIHKQEMIVKTDSLSVLKIFSLNLAYTQSHTFSFNPAHNHNIESNLSVDLDITPIFGKVKSFSQTKSNDISYLSYIGIIYCIILPIIILITGLYTIRSLSKVWIVIITGELLILASCLIFL